MSQSNLKTSYLIPSQLPEFIRDDPNYANFVLFLQAYYEWMEQQDGVIYNSKKLLEYNDIDYTSEQFLEYFTNDFLSYFPKDILTNKKQVIKIAKELYQSKGTPASYQLLFRLLYNSDVDFFYTKDAVLRASAGKWYVPVSVTLGHIDTANLPHWTNLNGLKIFGSNTKTVATIENTVIVGNRVEVFISNIERLFESGETVFVIDSNNQYITIDSNNLSGQIVGQINKANINPNYRGLYYVPGDPVVFSGGLFSNTGLGANAIVGTVTSGSIQKINTITGGYGYTNYPNTAINITDAPGALARVAPGGLDPDPNKTANVSSIPIDYIQLKKDVIIGDTEYYFTGNETANINTKLSDAFTFTHFLAYPISSVLVENGGGGITKQPTVSASSTYPTEYELSHGYLNSLGILAPIQIYNGGVGYEINDIITLTGGSGYGAYAKVTGVNTTGSIVSVEYVYPPLDTPHHYPLGGMGYINGTMPTVSVISANTESSNATLYVPGILGTGATFTTTVDRIGSVTTINILDYGQDYISAPEVSLMVQDILVSNVSSSYPPQKGNIVWQGPTGPNTASYFATVDSVNLVQTFSDPTQSLWNLRVFNYSSTPNPSLPLYYDELEDFDASEDYDVDLSVTMANTAFIPVGQTKSLYNANGVRTYGDGTAKATSTFLNGLKIGDGQYLDTKGQPSGFDILQNEEYNNYTYEITLEKEIAKYRSTLLNLLHPTGMQVIGRFAMKSTNTFNFVAEDKISTGYPLYHYTDEVLSNVTIETDFVNGSNNIVTFGTLNGANIADFLSSNSILYMVNDNGFDVESQVSFVNYTSNTVTLTDNVWLTFANVAYITANAGGNVINITTLTNSYDYVNNGLYSNTAYPLMDIVYAGDKVQVNNQIATVSSVDYIHGIILLDDNLTYGANGLMSVNRTFVTNTVQILVST